MLFFTFLGLAAAGLILLSPYFYGKITHLQFDPFLYPIHHITSTTCVLFSAIYHLMSCHEGGSEAYRCFITLDYLGIWLVTSLCCITFLKATLFCFSHAHKVVTGIYFLLCFISLFYVTKGYNPITRMKPLVALGAVRIFILYPTRCMMTNMGYMTGPLGTLWYLLGVEMIGLFGGLLNLSRLPERYFQGKMDYFFNSHNIMHLLVLLAPALLHSGTVMDFEWMQSTECPVWKPSISVCIFFLIIEQIMKYSFVKPTVKFYKGFRFQLPSVVNIIF